MRIKRLEIDGFRCLAAQTVTPHPDINLIDGPNASGKTSLLEAIYFLGRGRSFRAGRNAQLIRDGDPALLVAADLDGPPGRVAARASGDGLEIRVGAEPAGLAELASALPVQVIEPGVHKLVEEGPGRRRAFIDWGVFHVEPAFLDAWRRFRRALKQRNAALRSGAPDEQVRSWDGELNAAGGEVHRSRRAYTEDLAPVFAALAARLIDGAASIEFRPGWRGESLEEALEASWANDRARGATQVGPHRDDLAVRHTARRARSRVSRGQQKLIAAALILAQLRLLELAGNERGVLLIDDPAAELDGDRLARLFELVADVRAQRFITALDPRSLASFSEGHRFHVEQGALQKLV